MKTFACKKTRKQKRKSRASSLISSLSQIQALPTENSTTHLPDCPCSTMSPPYQLSMSLLSFASRPCHPRWSLRRHSESSVPSLNVQTRAWVPIPIRGLGLQRSVTAGHPRPRVVPIQSSLQRLRQRERQDHLVGDQMKKGNLNEENLSSQSVRENGQTGGRSWNQKGHGNVWKIWEQNRKSARVGLSMNASNAANPGQTASDEVGGPPEAVEHVAQ